MEENAISVNGICKAYDGFFLNNVSFQLPKGSVMGFVGENGAGKSTTIKSILNIVKPDSGSVQVFGMDNKVSERAIKENIAVVFDEIPFHGQLNASQLARIMKGIYRRWEDKQYFDYLTRFHLPVKKPIAEFSKGMKMKLQIAAALSHNAQLLIMDEATAGLDPVARSEMLDIFMEFMQDEEHSIFMSSHITSDIERIADSLIFIHNGKILLSGNKDTIMQEHGIMKCGLDAVSGIDDKDIVSWRRSDFGAEILVKNKQECAYRYPDFIMDNASLDDIMLFYIRGMDRKEWSI